MLLKRIKELLPESPAYFDKDQLTDKPARFFVSEIIREKILLYYDKEIPYSVEVAVESFKETPKNIHTSWVPGSCQPSEPAFSAELTVPLKVVREAALNLLGQALTARTAPGEADRSALEALSALPTAQPALERLRGALRRGGVREGADVREPDFVEDGLARLHRAFVDRQGCG